MHQNQNSNPVSFSGFTLKYIALLTMTIDHIAAVLLTRETVMYTLMRGIGRIAFPLYCFLLVEGYLHTSNRKSYFTRLMAFALLSEIPLDMALFHFPLVRTSSVLFGHQNVFFTLSLAFLAMYLMDYYWFRNQWMGFTGLILLGLLADLLKFDYGLTGVLVAVIPFLCRKFRPELKPVFLAILTVLPLFSPNSISGISVCLAIPCMVFYNGQKGSPLPKGRSFPGAKYLFYIYYPLHLLIISFIYFIV